MTKRTFPNPLLAALFLTALLTATAFADAIKVNPNHGTEAEFSVTINSDGEIDGAAELAKVTGLTRQCYDLIGLDTDPDEEDPAIGTDDLEGYDSFADDEEWYAIWKKTSCFAIKVYPNHGTEAEFPVTINSDGEIDGAAELAKVTGLTRQCYDLIGLDTDPDEEDPAIGTDDLEGYDSFADDEEWYAIWKKKEDEGCIFILAYPNLNGDGTGGTPVEINIDAKTGGNLTGNLPTGLTNACKETDYTWNTKADGTGDPKDQDGTFNDGQKIYIKWVAVDDCYRIKLDANNGKVNGQDFIILEAKKQTPTATASTLASLPTPTRAGNTHIFNDWKYGSRVVTTSTPFTEDAEIYADWARIPTTPVIAPAIASSFSIVVNSQNLQILGASKAMPVSIYNLKGKLVLNSTATPNESISVAHLPKGVYIVRAGSKTAKFAK